MSERVLVLGASGMLGSEAVRTLVLDFDVWGACRRSSNVPDLGVPMLYGLDATDPASADAIISQARPSLVINAVGIVKQLKAAKDAVPSITVNSLWPHILADACERHGARMVHVSTDCVFSGSRGMYTEADTPDATDLYGRSKLLGEVTDRECATTLRTSIIGWQHRSDTGLIGWFAAHRHESVKGFTKAVFSGLTTRALTEVIRDVVMPDASLSGLWHVSAEPIDKYTLLAMLAEYMGWSVDMTPSDELVIDRSLDSTRFRERTGWAPRSWSEMLAAL
jgi:dTDP-4-dehydrorhamnose reductase